MSKLKRKYKKNEIIKNWKVIRVDELKTLGAFLYELEHIKTKAKYAHIDINSKENVFCVAFKTIPPDSTGVAHILEHTVLSGSKNYPLRDPFFSMLRRSLNTFMNAFTSNDWTAYPFATQNKKDFYNLMGVYLDATFFPLLNELNFKQEGHRLEYENKKLKIKGVVYNEMKGVYSSPDQIMNESIPKALFPTNSYYFDAGGDPKEIPNLSYEQFKNFHKKYYHPSNAYFYSFGNFSLEKHLDFIEKKVMNEFSSSLKKIKIKKEKNFLKPKKQTFYYPAEKKNKDKYQVAYAYRLMDIKNSFLVLCFELIEDLLIGSPSAYLRRELINSGLGSDLSDSSSFDCDYKETIFSFGLKDVSQKNILKVKNLIDKTLEKIIQDGFQKKDIKAAIHRLNISHRIISNNPYPYGLKLWMRLIPHWLHGSFAFEGVSFEKEIKQLEKSLEKKRFLENLLKKYFLNNKNKSFIILAPDLTKIKRDEKEEMEKLKKIEKRLSAEEKKKILEDSLALEKLQNSSEDLSILPIIKIKDIPNFQKAIDGRKVNPNIFDYSCQINNLFYARFDFTLSFKNQKDNLISLIPLFCEIFPKMGLKNKNYLDLDREINLYTGGIELNPVSQTNVKKEIKNHLSFTFNSLGKNIKPAFNIIKSLIFNYDFSDLNILEKYIKELKAGQESEIINSGHNLSASLALRNFSPSLALREKWEGVSQFLFLKELSLSLNQEKLKNIQNNLNILAGEIFSKEMKVALVGDKKDIKKSLKPVTDIIKNLQGVNRKNKEKNNVFSKEKKVREAWITTTQVSFLSSVFKTACLKDKDAAGLFVLSKLLSAKYLHREIREKGGAYGGFARYNYMEGYFQMSSYRDPNLLNTLNVFKGALNFLKSDKYKEEDLSEAILGAIAQLDKPGTINEEALREFNYEKQGLSLKLRQDFRRRVLNVKIKDIKYLAQKYFKKNWEDYSTVVISNEKEIKKANKILGKSAFLVKYI